MGAGNGFTVETVTVTPDALTDRVRKIVKESGIEKGGSCHAFRHTSATNFLEGGADIRFVQAFLGHSKLETTEIYTHVAITKLKEVYGASHPAARLGRTTPAVAREDGGGAAAAKAEQLLVALADEAEDDHEPEGNAEELPSTKGRHRSRLR